MSQTPKLQLQRFGHGALVAGLVALGLCIAGVVFDPSRFFQSWLVAWIFFGGLSFGALVIFMMQSLTGGAWGVVIHDFCEAAMMTLPLVGVLFLPVIFGAHELFPWARASELATHPAWLSKQSYLNLPFFTIRAAFYFLSLGALAFWLRQLSIGRAKKPKEAGKWIARFSGGGLVFYVLCMNFASTDWVMSLEPDWYSTIFVVIFMVSQFLSALASMTVLLIAFANKEPYAGVVTTKHFHDLGNLLLAFVIFWAYVAFSQFLITWSGNLPKEIAWYLHRSRGGWPEVARGLALAGFLLPVALLLFRTLKQKPERLAVVAALILATNLVHVFWLIMPAFHPEGVRVHWLDLATLTAVGGLWVSMFLWFLRRQPLWAETIGKVKIT